MRISPPVHGHTGLAARSPSSPTALETNGSPLFELQMPKPSLVSPTSSSPASGKPNFFLFCFVPPIPPLRQVLNKYCHSRFRHTLASVCILTCCFRTGFKAVTPSSCLAPDLPNGLSFSFTLWDTERGRVMDNDLCPKSMPRQGSSSSFRSPTSCPWRMLSRGRPLS